MANRLYGQATLERGYCPRHGTFARAPAPYDPGCPQCIYDASGERIGRGICDGCGEERELTAFNVPGVAVGICMCDDCNVEPVYQRENSDG